MTDSKKRDLLIETLRQLDPWERINALADHRPLRPEQAAVFMDLSLRKLLTMRQQGTGPAYFQGNERVEPPAKREGTNRHVQYFKQDILAWWGVERTPAEPVKPKYPIRAFGALDALAREEAFYVDALGRVEGMVEDGALGLLLERVEQDWEIAWLPVVDALGWAWADLARHRACAETARAVLAESALSIEAGLEKTELAEEVRKSEAERDSRR